MPKLFEEAEINGYKARAKKTRNALANEILAEIERRGFVAPDRHAALVRLTASEFKKWEIDAWRVSAPLSIYIYNNNGIVWYRYSYPYCDAKRVEHSTRVLVKQASGFPSGMVKLPPKIWELIHLLRFEEVDQFLMHSRAFSGLNFLSQVEDPRGLLEKLVDLEGEHSQMLMKDTKEAIAYGANPKLIQQMRSRLLRYSPGLYEIMENDLRIQAGKLPIKNLSDLLKIERLERKKQTRRR